MAKLYNLAREYTRTTGIGTLTLGGAVAGFLTFGLAGVTTGKRVPYGIKDGNNSEVGEGVYTVTGSPDAPTLTRVVTKSTNNDNAISLSGNAQVYITPRDQEMGMHRLAFGSVASVGTLDIDLSNFTDYRGIVIYLSGFRPVTDNVDLWARFSTDNGGSYDASGYQYANVIQFGVTSSPSTAASTSANQIVLTANVGSGNVGNAATEGLNGRIELLNQSSVAFFPRISYQCSYLDAEGTADITLSVGTGVRSSAMDVDHIRFLFSSGNITEGNYEVYGLI